MKQILCYRNSKLGDYLITIPAIRLIKKNKDCRIYYLTVSNKYYKELPKTLEKTKIVDEFIYFNNNFLDKLRLIFFLRKKNFDEFYYLQEKSNLYREIRDYIFFNLSNIKKIYGFFKKQENFFENSETIKIAKRVNSQIVNKDIISLVNINKQFNKPIYKKEYITISIGGFSQPVIWNLKNWSILVKLILNKFNYKILITGTQHDLQTGNALSLVCKKNIINLCGRINLKDILNIIKFSKYHITNDNGSMHIASLYKKKTICLFNNHDPLGKWYPANNNAIIFRPKEGVNYINPYKVFNKLIQSI
jgi:ADP-heptose:LPS heptosyltransferase